MEKTKRTTTTHKKQKFTAVREFIDAETGEVVPMQMNTVEDRDFNFHKMWLQMFINGLEEIANKKMKLAFWIIDHLDSENKLCYTFQQMAEKTGLHYDTVVKTMKMLQNGNPPFLKKLHSGLYVVNPSILYKGTHKSRMGVVYQFGELTDKMPKQTAENDKKAKEKTASDAPQASQTVENASAGENVPAEEKKSEFQPSATEMEKKVELPQLSIDPNLSEAFVPVIYQNRDELFNQFINQTTLFDDSDYTEKVRQIFLTELSADFWFKVFKLENILSFHTEWKARHDKKQ